ncbi:IS66 family transposase [Synoicihabitans lomoniglobus]|uniref:IS66 family transposase n=1 Tax=Synoicihabitans lomoniglobus TaxID=2909285 RepID=A0AAF0CR88_9BACT|nr:IS66 family transposase [Opitutaceae bacterium LMO-M01]WED66577.1 IS66 family transposase [Opitutaceae bacterium LMO-M01]WED66826.1 IS66 family transposase [Opitutaceae bacterium LMO-M01]
MATVNPPTDLQEDDEAQVLRLECERLEQENHVLGTELKALNAEMAYMQRQLEALKRKLFGQSRGEQVSEAQLNLALDEMERERAQQEEVPKEVIGYARRRPQAEESQARLPEDLETITEEIIPEEVRAEPEAYERIGEEVTEELDVQPMKVIRRRIVRPKFKRKGQAAAAPFIAPLPARVIPGGLPAAGLIAFLLVAKYVDHLPLYRLEKSFKQRFGVKLPRQRLCDWTGYAIENWLLIIYHSIRQGLIGGDYLQIDETPIRYLDPDRKGQSSRGYLWVYGHPGGDLCFDWSLGRGKAAAEAIVCEFTGLLQSDGYQVYDRVSEGREITQLGCWAHARRRFYDAYQAGESGAAHYLVLIRDLYAIEASLPAEASVAQVAEIRAERSVPVLAQIRQSLDEDIDTHMPRTAIADAIGYARSQWSKLTAYVQHGQTRIDNNLTEQAIRPTKLGAKNWLFIGHPGAGKRAAIIYTILECCRRHNVEPLAYLNDVLHRLPGMTNHQVAAAKLTPRDWKPAA